MLSRIVDVVHTLAAWHFAGDAPDWDAARGAVLRGLDIDETAKVLYRDWIAIEQAAGNVAASPATCITQQHLPEQHR